MTIDRNPHNNSILYLRDSQWASKFFNILNQPKRKFTFVAGLIPHSHAVQHDEFRTIILDNLFLLKAFDPPKIEFDTDILDEYNKKRIIQKKVNYSPVSMRFHDDIDNKIYSMFIKYFQYYYKDSFNIGNNDWNIDTYKEFIKSGSWGLKTNPIKYFFEKIFVAWVNGGKVTIMFLQHPVISDLQFDTLDYSDGGTPLEISMSFDYEGILFKEVNVDINDDKDFLNKVRNALLTTEEIGQPFSGPDVNTQVPGKDRNPGIGELANAGLTFYGKYNNKPTVEDAMNDFIIRPAAGYQSGSLQSWGNFNFGGIGTAKSKSGAFNSNTGAGYKYVTSGGTVTDNFSQNTSSSLSDTRANSQFLSSTGADDKI